jgi:hypothetical protein
MEICIICGNLKPKNMPCPNCGFESKYWCVETVTGGDG